MDVEYLVTDDPLRAETRDAKELEMYAYRMEKNVRSFTDHVTFVFCCVLGFLSYLNSCLPDRSSHVLNAIGPR